MWPLTTKQEEAKKCEQVYKNKLIIVTGATSGNGRALANELLKSGATVIGIGRREDRLKELIFFWIGQ